jgi:hypothetical protein
VISLPETERLVPVEWSAFKLNHESGRVVLNAKMDQLKSSLNPEDTKDLSPSIKELVKGMEHVRKETKASSGQQQGRA